MRALSARAAARCEAACTPRCRCRCSGALHGKGRLSGVSEGGERGFLESLPEDDPHHVAPKAKKREE